MGINVQNTINELRELAQTHKRVAVGYSGGKDSLCVIDLAYKTFDEVVPFYYYFVPGLEQDERMREYARKRFGAEIAFFPRLSFLQAFADGIYCDFFTACEPFLEINPFQYKLWVMQTLECTLVLDGVKKADGTFRRRVLGNESETQRKLVIHPIKNWVKWEVLDYLKANNLEPPKATARAAAGNEALSLSVHDMLVMKDEWPNDFETVKQYFPYVEAIVARREMFGLTDG